MKSSINTLATWLVLAILASGCSAPAPKPVITKAAETADEQVRLDAASAAFSKALKSLAEKKYDKAEEQLQEMAKQYPEFPGIYANLGIVYTHTDRDKEAQEAFKKALTLKPNFPSVLNQLAYLHRSHGRFDLARKAYLHALKVDPTYADTHLNLGILYDLYLMDTASALKHYTIYRDMTQPPESDPVHKWIVDLTDRVEKVAQEPLQGN